MNEIGIEELKNKTIAEIRGKVGDPRIEIDCVDGSRYVMLHVQDCCESVTVEDICGDLADLIGSPIVQAEASSNRDTWPDGVPLSQYMPDSYTWTFYRLATAKGQVVIRWLGESNGYYSEDVEFVRVA